MLVAVCLCMLALALPCWTFPSGHITTCEEFGRGVSFDPVNAVGEWFLIYTFEDHYGNYTENITIRELTSSQLEQYDHILTRYSKDKLKLMLKSRISYLLVQEVDTVLVPQDDAGNVDAWLTRVVSALSSPALYIDNPIPHQLKWKSVDGFLVTMECGHHKVNILSKTTTPDEDKLQRAVDSLGIEGITGRRVNSSLLTLL